MSLYTAGMEWLPADRLDVLKVATPLLLSGLVPSGVVPSRNVTAPVGLPLAEVTVAVNVTDWPNVDGLADDVRLVLVLASLTTWETVDDVLLR